MSKNDKEAISHTDSLTYLLEADIEIVSLMYSLIKIKTKKSNAGYCSVFGTAL